MFFYNAGSAQDKDTGTEFWKTTSCPFGWAFDVAAGHGYFRVGRPDEKFTTPQLPPVSSQSLQEMTGDRAVAAAAPMDVVCADLKAATRQ